MRAFEPLAAAALALAAIALAWLKAAVSHWALQRRLAAYAAADGGPPPLVPPLVPGVPLLGNALALGSGGAAFLHQCRKQHGDAFTLRLLGQRMSFIFAPAALQHYFLAPDHQLTFAPAVQQFTHRVFGLPPRHFYPRHLTMLQALRHQLVPSALPQHTERLMGLLLARLERWPAAGQLELVGELKGLVFEASVGALFGPAFLGQPAADGSSERPQQTAGTAASTRTRRLQEAFFAFEGGFELAASPVPHALQPRFLAARRTLLAALRQSYQAGHFKGTVAGALIDACGLPAHCVPNMLLALLWASQANAVPTIFWVMGFLLLPENKAHLAAVIAEAQQAAGLAAPAAGTPAAAAPQQQQQGKGRGAGSSLLTLEQQQGLVSLACNRRSHVAAGVSETLRLRCFSIDVRIAAADGALPGGVDGSGPGIWGDVVAISPYESHLDARLYGGDAAAFNPGRQGMQLGGTSAVHAAVPGVGGVPGLAFGGGKYRCPGRAFAEAELALIASLLLLLYDWQLLPRSGAAGKQQQGAAAGTDGAAAAPAFPGDPHGLLPPPDLTKLVGIKVPAEPCFVQFQRRGLAG